MSCRRGVAAIAACVAGSVLVLGGPSAVAQEMPGPASPGEPEPSEPAPPALGNETYVVEAPPPAAPRVPVATAPVEEELPPPEVVVEELPLPAVVAVPPAPIAEPRPVPAPERPHRTTPAAAKVAATSDPETSTEHQIQAGLAALTAVLLVAAFWPTKKSPYLSS